MLIKKIDMQNEFIIHDTASLQSIRSHLQNCCIYNYFRVRNITPAGRQAPISQVLWCVYTFPTPRPTRTDKKWVLTNGVEVYTAQRQTPTQIPSGFCTNLSVSVSVGLSVGSVSIPLDSKEFY